MIYAPHKEQDYWRVQGTILLQYFRRGSYVNKELDALQLMMVVETASTTNPKDKVIGIRAILQQIGIDLPEFTYGMSQQHLYTTLAERWMSHWSSLRLLQLVGPDGTSSGLPSWVVDWDMSSQHADHSWSNTYTRLVYLQCTDSLSRRPISATRGCAPASNTFADVFTSARLRWRGKVLTSIKECVGPSGVTHRFAREDESEADVDRERVRLWSQTARTVLIWAQFLATVFSTRSFGSPSIDCFASAMNVGPKTLITSQYLRTNFEADLQTITKLTTHLELDDANSSSPPASDTPLEVMERHRTQG